MEANYQILTSQTSSGTRRNSILSSRSRFALYPFSFVFQYANDGFVVNIPNLSSAGVVADKDQNVYLSYSPYTTATSLQEANDTFSPIRLQNAKGSLSFPPLYPISARQNKAKEDNTATSTLWPSLHSFFLPSLASTVNEREEGVIEGTILGLKQEEGLEEPKAVVGNSKYYLNKVSKKRIADQAYLKKKADVYQNLQRFKDN